MADICIIYSRSSQATARQLREVLSKRFAVWWDQDIVSGDYRREIEYQLSLARCVIPVWCRVSRGDPDVIDEATFASKRNKQLLPVRIEDVEPPLGFGSLNSFDLTGWDGAADDPRVEDLVEKIGTALGSRRRRLASVREVRVSGKGVSLPVFVPSVSSHETQLRPAAGAQVLALYHAPVVLVSAYDLSRDPERALVRKHLGRIRENAGVIFVDSGNYEAYRKKDRTWSQAEFHRLLREFDSDLAFSFDRLDTPATISQAASAVLKSIERDRKVAKRTLVPIVHVPRTTNGKARTDLLPGLMAQVTKALKPILIAVPERELGDGLIERARMIMIIRDTLNELGFYQPLHLLGTGNPLAIAVFAAAGADSFDGLEWCRTAVDRETALLYHHQQYDFFRYQTALSSSAVVQAAATDPKASFVGRLALHNIDFYFEWSSAVRDNLRRGTLDRFLAMKLPKGAFDDLVRQLPELVS